MKNIKNYVDYMIYASLLGKSLFVAFGKHFVFVKYSPLLRRPCLETCLKYQNIAYLPMIIKLCTADLEIIMVYPSYQKKIWFTGILL